MSSSLSSSTPAASPPIASAAAAGWNRVAYYTAAAPSQATGIAWMANRGGSGSGTFDTYVTYPILLPDRALVNMIQDVWLVIVLCRPSGRWERPSERAFGRAARYL